mmetsp:Transcript_69920/g.227609  ORF Transcript_69920/g.227609 Transcript_69920/m.227609 type:complete len:235 (+) Transcript_69920:580-1284(+)
MTSGALGVGPKFVPPPAPGVAPEIAPALAASPSAEAVPPADAPSAATAAVPAAAPAPFFTGADEEVDGVAAVTFAAAGAIFATSALLAGAAELGADEPATPFAASGSLFGAPVPVAGNAGLAAGEPAEVRALPLDGAAGGCCRATTAFAAPSLGPAPAAAAEPSPEVATPPEPEAAASFGAAAPPKKLGTSGRFLFGGGCSPKKGSDFDPPASAMTLSAHPRGEWRRRVLLEPS